MSFVRRVMSAGALTLAAAAVVAAFAGAGSAAPAGGPIALYASLDNAGSNKVVIAGAIGDYGTARNVNKNGKPDPNGNFVRFKLQKGTFEMDVTTLSKTLSDPKPQVQSEATCSGMFTGEGAVTFLKGTGLYKGMSGTANLSVTLGGVDPRYKVGAKKGQCKNGEPTPRSQFGFVTGQGAVSFGS
jgi:hypothetical protein